MTSLTKKTERIRKNKRIAGGKARKRATAKGTTPRFPIHLEDQPDALLPQPPGSEPAPKVPRAAAPASKPAARPATTAAAPAAKSAARPATTAAARPATTAAARPAPKPAPAPEKK
jgi:hypothetical protein